MNDDITICGFYQDVMKVPCKVAIFRFSLDILIRNGLFPSPVLIITSGPDKFVSYRLSGVSERRLINGRVTKIISDASVVKITHKIEVTFNKSRLLGCIFIGMIPRQINSLTLRTSSNTTAFPSAELSCWKTL